jgi:hypothetical protein
MKRCRVCGAPWEEKHEPGKNESCMRCGADMHACRNCRLFDPLKARQCASMTADPPSDKESANDCDEFQLADREDPVSSKDDRKKELDEKWKGLFKE